MTQNELVAFDYLIQQAILGGLISYDAKQIQDHPVIVRHSLKVNVYGVRIPIISADAEETHK